MTGAREIGAPEHLTPAHDVTDFDSGVPALDDWLKRRALDNEKAHASRTYVVTAGGRVVGYYALANGAVSAADAPGRVRRNMPDPIPVMIIGRLAVDRGWQGRGIASGLSKTRRCEPCRRRGSPASAPSLSMLFPTTPSASISATAS
jgi:GNAT superfamily N-acetyltransferase